MPGASFFPCVRVFRRYQLPLLILYTEVHMKRLCSKMATFMTRCTVEKYQPVAEGYLSQSLTPPRRFQHPPH